MLRIYTGDGAADKEKYVFDHIDPHEKSILIVPDQFSLQAERDALRLLEREALTDLMVVDFSALGYKVVQEREGKAPQIIDRYGRHMLLSVLIQEMSDELVTYRGMGGRVAFADQMNTMISEMKRYGVDTEQLRAVLDTLKAREEESGQKKDTYFLLKLEDILRIYERYEEKIAGAGQDAEDYIDYYAERIPDSPLVQDAEVWIYGFDTFTPKNLAVIRQLIRTARNVSVVLTREEKGEGLPLVRSLTMNGGAHLFDLTDTVIRRLEHTAEEAGAEHCLCPMEGEERSHMWRGTPEEIRRRITLCRTTDPHHEAERAAAFIRHLVRDEGYRYGEIAVICNDIDGLGAMVARSLQRMGTPVFADHRRRVLHQPMVSFLLSFLDVITRGYQGEGIMGMIKSGLLGWTMEDENLLENYVYQFRVRGSRWREKFRYNGEEYTDEEMARLNEMREELVSVCDRARDSIGRRNTAEEKVHGLYGFLEKDFRVQERIGQLIEQQTECGLEEGAAETAQIWNTVCGLLDQIIRVIGPEKVSNTVLADMIRSGLGSMEIGLVPVSADSLLMGTLQRTRPGRVRALVVVGAADGVLPLQAEPDGLLTRREMEILEGMDLELARKEKVAAQEEQMAIYRMFSLPEEQLYVSVSTSSSGGDAQRPSAVFRRLEQMQPSVLGNLEDGSLLDMVVDRRGTVSYLAQAVRAESNGEAVNTDWRTVGSWYQHHDPKATDRLRQAVGFSNRWESLGEEMADALYRGDADQLRVSASRMELFSGCAFAHFISYGLRAHERRLFEVGGREIGDVYHRCIMEYCRGLAADEAAGKDTGWSRITREACGEIIRGILSGAGTDYRGGLLTSDGSNQLRLERIGEICSDVAWALTEQIRQGSVARMRFEEPFGRGGTIPPVEVEVNGRKVQIVGTIDRLDMLGEDGGAYAGADGASSMRIVDYKTGERDVDLEEIRRGYQLQLPVYMMAAEGMGESAEPAGILYFQIREVELDGEKDKRPDPDDPSALERRMRREYRLKGVVVNDPRILGDMDEALAGGDKVESMVIPVKYDPEKEAYASTRKGTELLDMDEFQELLAESRRQVERICGEICEGTIQPVPRRKEGGGRDGDDTACRFCDYRSICLFDRSFPWCREKS